MNAVVKLVLRFGAYLESYVSDSLPHGEAHLICLMLEVVPDEDSPHPHTGLEAINTASMTAGVVTHIC
jgi:hypothetical protein